jgi:hypothetical protein
MLVNLSKTIAIIKEISVPKDRKDVLQTLVEYIQNKVNANEEIRLNFICTHNSRRSHLSQIWAQTMAFHFGIKNVFCYSGGTEATAMFPKVAETLTNQGFEIQQLSQEQNPVYAVKFDENQHPIICFSKTYFDDFTHRTPFTKVALNDIFQITDFTEIQVFKFRQLPIVWKYPFLNIFCEFISPFIPVRTKNKFLRWSRELMLIGYCIKPNQK